MFGNLPTKVPKVPFFVLLAAALGGCGAASKPTGTAHGERAAPHGERAAPHGERAAPHGERAALVGYLRQVEPIRLGVNRLLEGADPILSAYRARRIPAREAALRMGSLERRFAAYTVQMAAVEPATAALRSLNTPYAHTYVLEDSYLSALTAGLAQGDFGGLPDTQSAQRAAIVQWRTALTVLAQRAGLALPADLQAAGRGEIAPSPSGS